MAKDSWVPPSDLSSLDVLEVQALLNTLSNLIDDYESTPIDGSSMDESQRLMERRSQTLQRIDDTKSELDKVLAADKGPDGPPFDGGGQELTSETPIEDTRNEATLLKLDVSHGVLDFDPETVRYDIDLEGDVERLIVTAVAADPRAVIEVVSASPDSNWGHAISCSDGAFAVPILNGDDTIVSIRVSTEDGETSQTYTVNVTNAGFDDIVVSDIHLSDGEIVFDPLVSKYESIVENSVHSLTITPMLSDPRAAVRIVANDEIGSVVDVVTLVDGSFKIPSLPVGQTLVSIAVGAEAAPISDAYVIAVIRRANADVTLNSLSLSAGTLDFDPRQTEYNVDLPAEIENMDIVPETTHGGATVSVAAQLQDTGPTAGLDSQDGVFRVTGIGEGRSVVTLSVVSEDKTASQDYVLHIVRHSGAGTNLERLLWSRVMHDDIAGAYWIAESLQARQLPAPVPPLLLMAVQGARWLSPVWDQYVEDLAAIVSEVSISDDEDSHVLLRLAASIRPSLVAPETNLLAWVSSPRCLPEIEMLVSAVRDFASRGYALRSELINPGQGDEALQTLISAASADLRLWLDEARQHHTRFARANSVWQHLCSNGLLSAMLPHVIHDNREQVEMVRSNLAEMDRENAAIETINQIDRSLLGHSVPKADITGTARTWLLRRMREATTRITLWCELVELERAARQQDAGNWLQEQVLILREKIRVQYPNAIAALLRLSADSDNASLAASAQCMARSLDDLLDHLGLSIHIGPRHATTAIVEDLRTINAKAGSSQGGEASLGFLHAAVAKRLLWLPAVDLDDSGWPTRQSQLPDLPSEDLSLDDAIRVRIENDDFRFFDFLSSGVAHDRQLVLRDAYGHELKAAQDTLYDRIPKVREEVEQAANDGVIEYEGAQWNSLVGQLADIDVEQTLNFRFVHDSLQRIRNSVREDRERRREELIAEWAQLSLAFKEGAPADAAFLADSQNIFRLASAPTSPDIRVMEDCVSGLRNYRSGEHPNLPITPRRDHRNRLEDFLSFADEISDPQSYAAESKGLKMLLRGN